MHDLWLFVFDGEDYGLNDCRELLGFEFDHAEGAVLDDVEHKQKEALSEFRERDEIIFDHL